MLRKDLFFFGASAGSRAACEDISVDVGIEPTLAVGDSACSSVGSIGREACDESRHSPVRTSARTHAPHWSGFACASGDCAQARECLQPMFESEDTGCEVCGKEGWPRSTAVLLLLLMWGKGWPQRGWLFDTAPSE